MSIDVSAVFSIGTVVDAMLPRFGSVQEGKDRWDSSEPAKALRVTVRLDRAVYVEGEGDTSKRKYVHLLFCRPHNYTAVFCAVTDSPRQALMQDFQMTSYRDSAWRSDGFSLLRAAHREMGKRLPEGKILDHNIIDRISWCEIQWTGRELTHLSNLTD